MFKNTGWRNSILEGAIFLPYSSSDSILELTLEKRVSAYFTYLRVYTRVSFLRRTRLAETFLRRFPSFFLSFSLSSLLVKYTASGKKPIRETYSLLFQPPICIYSHEQVFRAWLSGSKRNSQTTWTVFSTTVTRQKNWISLCKPCTSYTRSLLLRS